ncbi:MAG: hypothetical protein AAF267_25480 [Deinococcota bacterium]
MYFTPNSPTQQVQTPQLTQRQLECQRLRDQITDLFADLSITNEDNQRFVCELVTEGKRNLNTMGVEDLTNVEGYLWTERRKRNPQPVKPQPVSTLNVEELLA